MGCAPPPSWALHKGRYRMGCAMPPLCMRYSGTALCTQHRRETIGGRAKGSRHADSLTSSRGHTSTARARAAPRDAPILPNDAPDSSATSRGAAAVGGRLLERRSARYR